MKLISNQKVILGGLMVATLLLVLLPVLDTIVTIGDEWKGVPMLYTDEVLYYAQVREVAEGHPFFGNPYFYEHREGRTAAFFGANWLASIPFFLGLSLPQAILANFLVWGPIFVLTVFYLLRRLGVGALLSAVGALFTFIQSYLTAYRMSIRQEVFPFFFLFYAALFIWMEKPRDTKRIVILAISAGTSFYLYSFFWQVVVSTLGLVFLYSVALYFIERSDTSLKRFIDRHSVPRIPVISIVKTGLLTLLIASPVIYYTFQQLHTPYYWDAMNRFGLIATHVPTAEVVYSGSWVFILLALFILSWRFVKLPFLFTFFALTGVAMVCLQASNFITGKELETAQHVKSFIVPWLSIGFFTWLSQSWHRIQFKSVRGIVVAIIALAVLWANVHFILFITPFPGGETQALRRDMQSYAAPLAWLDEKEPLPVVIWSDPVNNITPYIPGLTKHYVLYAEPGNLNILSHEEVEERYLVTRYFDGVSTTTLKEEFPFYAGRSKTYHYPKTLERKQKICRILRVEDTWDWCPKVTDRFALVGDEYFTRLIARYTNDIVPNIDEKLAAYHVKYILKDKKQGNMPHPERLLGTVKEYDDGRFEIYRYE